MRKLGIYGGTFDPVHNAHLILAREALELLELEQVIFVPAAVSPHKHAEDAASAAVRLEMLRVGITDEPGFAIDEQELQRPAPSFTFDTVAAIRSADATSELFFLIGQDNVAALPSWHRFDELRQLVEFVVLERTASVTEHPYRTIRRHIDVSATDIRNRVARGASIRYLVPPAVEEIIHAGGLYREQRQSLKKT